MNIDEDAMCPANPTGVWPGVNPILACSWHAIYLTQAMVVECDILIYYAKILERIDENALSSSVSPGAQFSFELL